MLLDCTLRDGGYYTGWNFSKEFLDGYIDAVNMLQVDAIEIGYCSNNTNLGHGEFYYCSDILLKYVKKILSTKTQLGIMLNAKEFSNQIDLSCLNGKTKEIDFIRIAADPKDASNVQKLVSKIVSEYDLPVYINFMYMHSYASDLNMMQNLLSASTEADGISFVDSFGCVRPDEVKKSVESFRPLWKKKLGFHGHDNLGLVAANSLAAIDSGCDIVDSTFTGMGRGAGNMRTEDMALLQNDPSALSDQVCQFVSSLSKMKIEKGWGSNYAYASAAAKQIPQQKVMDILSLNRFSLNEVLSKVLKTADKEDSHKNIDAFQENLIKNNSNPPIVVGGGETFKSFLSWRPGTIFENRKVIFVSRKSLEHFLTNISPKFLSKLELIFIAPNEEIMSFKKCKAISIDNIKYIPAQKIMLTESQKGNTGIIFLLEKLQINAGNDASFPQSPLYTALKLVELSEINEALMLGFDGYDGKNILEYETEFCFVSSELKLISPYASSYSLICE